MDDHIELTRGTLRHLVAQANPKPINHTIKLGLGFKDQLTIAPAQIDIQRSSIIIPVAAEKLPNIIIRLYDISLEPGWLWFAVEDVKLGRFDLPVGKLVNRLAAIFIGDNASIRQDQGRYAVPTQKLFHKLPVTPTAITIQDGIRITFVPAGNAGAQSSGSAGLPA